MCFVVSDFLGGITDDGKSGILVLLGLSAAFDTVVHKLLLSDLRSVNIVGGALQYLDSYIKERTYCAQVGSAFSSTETLTRGVPQGRVLGPMLFCIYTIG